MANLWEMVKDIWLTIIPPKGQVNWNIYTPDPSRHWSDQPSKVLEKVLEKKSQLKYWQLDIVFYALTIVLLPPLGLFSWGLDN